jgi:hypothetical protein
VSNLGLTLSVKSASAHFTAFLYDKWRDCFMELVLRNEVLAMINSSVATPCKEGHQLLITDY